MTSGEPPVHRKAKDFRWDGVAVQPYKEDARVLFKAITRQVLFAPADQGSELRYFEVAPGGFSTLERHEHTHAVLILRGRGTVLLDGDVQEVRQNDLVSKERDRPQLPSESERATLERR